MRGKDVFRKSKPAINLFEMLLGMIPEWLVLSAFEWARHVPGYLGFGLRYVLIRRLASSCGEVVAIYPGAYILNIEQLTIGDCVSIHQMCYLECAGGLTIGSKVSLSHGVSVISHEHDYMQTETAIRDAPVLLKPVIIEDDVWIGAGSRILAGTTIGRGAVIGAGAVVTRSIPPYSVAVGVPARVTMKRNRDEAY